MDKYTILIILNLPFVIFGIIKAIILYKESSVGRLTLAIRLIFWLTIGFCIFFAEDIYNFLVESNLTDSTPLSLADVVLVTGVSFCFFLLLRMYTKLDNLERKVSDVQEKVSIELSKKK